MKRLSLVIGALIAAVVMLKAALAPAAATPPAEGPAACPALLDHTFPGLQDEKPRSMCQYAGKVVLVVNTASFCGYTGQYEGLERLYDKYKARGLVVVGSGPRPCWAWPVWRTPLGMSLAGELPADVLIVPKALPRRVWAPARRP